MPGIDFVLLKQQLELARVLELVGFRPRTRRGPVLRGPCPVHGSTSPRSRSFAAHLDKKCWRCFTCGAGGNALDLYLAVSKLPVYAGALELCERLRLPVPWLSWRPVGNRSDWSDRQVGNLPPRGGSPP